MISWGIVACAMMLIRGRISFFTLRFLLGVAEAGFFPGMIFYLNHWFPVAERARAVSRFMMAIPVAGVLWRACRRASRTRRETRTHRMAMAVLA